MLAFIYTTDLCSVNERRTRTCYSQNLPPPLVHPFYCRHMASNPSSEKLWVACYVRTRLGVFCECVFQSVHGMRRRLGVLACYFNASCRRMGGPGSLLCTNTSCRSSMSGIASSTFNVKLNNDYSLQKRAYFVKTWSVQDAKTGAATA